MHLIPFPYQGVRNLSLYINVFVFVTAIHPINPNPKKSVLETSPDLPFLLHAFRVRLQQSPSLLPYFQNIFSFIPPTSYMSSLSNNCPNLSFHCPIFQSHPIALLPGWQVWTSPIFCCRTFRTFVFCSLMWISS